MRKCCPDEARSWLSYEGPPQKPAEGDVTAVPDASGCTLWLLPPAHRTTRPKSRDILRVKR